MQNKINKDILMSTIVIPRNLHCSAKKFAKSNGMTVSGLTTMAIKNYLEQNQKEKKNQK